MRIGDEVILNLACTGAVSDNAINENVPVSYEQIIEDVNSALKLGVQIFHLHARDKFGRHSNDQNIHAKLIRGIRQLPGGNEAILCVSTSGRNDPDFAKRSLVLDLDGDSKPDFASLTLGSLNFMNDVSINTPDTIRMLASRMLEREIRPEIEIFDLGMANFVNVLLKEGLLKAPLYINILLGNISGAQCNPLHLEAILSSLPKDSIVTIGGIGNYQLTANTMGMIFTDGVRVGLEDNLWFDCIKKTPASNLMLLKRVKRLSDEFERPLQSRSALRHRLGLSN